MMRRCVGWSTLHSHIVVLSCWRHIKLFSFSFLYETNNNNQPKINWSKVKTVSKFKVCFVDTHHNDHIKI